MRLVFLLPLSFVLLMAGCDSTRYTQYIVSKASPADKAVIKKALKEGALIAGLNDTTSTSKVPHTIACYTDDADFPMCLGARTVGDAAVVDLIWFLPGTSKPPRYLSVESSLNETLSREFGARLMIPDYENRIRLEPSNEQKPIPTLR